MTDLYTEVIMGRDLLLSVWDSGTNAYKDIAAQKDGGINITRETIDITTKPDWPIGTTDEAGNTPAVGTLHGVGMKKFKPGFASWSSDVNGLTTTDTFGTQVLLTACLAATYVRVQFTVGINQVIWGYALVTSANRTGPMGDASTFSANLQGTGGFVELTGYPQIMHQTVPAPIAPATVAVLDALTLPAGTTYTADSETVAVNGVALVKDVDYTIVDGTRVITITTPVEGSYATIAYAVSAAPTGIGYLQTEHQVVQAGGVLAALHLPVGSTYIADSETISVNGVTLVKDVGYTIVDGTRIITVLSSITGSYATINFSVTIP